MHRNKGIVDGIQEHRASFAIVFLGIFTLLLLFLMATDNTPDPLSQVKEDMTPEAPVVESATSTPELPVRVSAKAIGLDARINNPRTTDVTALDESLLTGAVRYPTSAFVNQEGTVLLFGHSSYLPVVRNLSYKTFNDIQKLKAGDIVSVYSGAAEYRYSVTGVRSADATQDGIDLPTTGRHLVLVTCDSFTKKTDRFIVTADFVGAYSPAPR